MYVDEFIVGFELDNEEKNLTKNCRYHGFRSNIPIQKAQANQSS